MTAGRSSDAGPGRVDLHLHSTESDGTTSPADVVRRVAEAGLSGFSLTDHDTTSGLDEAEAAAREHGVRFLPGAELSATEPGRSVHLLSFGFDRASPALQTFLRLYDGDRRARARKMADRLCELGVAISYEDVEAQAGRAAPTRAHVARALVARGRVPDEARAFDRYLSRDRPAFVPKRPVAPREVFDIVHGAGGVVVLAHPGRHFGPDDVRALAAEGLDGVEVYHPSNSKTVRSRMRSVADELGLLKTGGSDWHGPGTRRDRLGFEPVPIDWMDEIARRTASTG